uniref:Metallophos domain-containing protein n=1 Tax=Heterorhabditis bacteriophora TaxID=37862 RepID=A0A1I7XH05_HETBA
MYIFQDVVLVVETNERQTFVSSLVSVLINKLQSFWKLSNTYNTNDERWSQRQDDINSKNNKSHYSFEKLRFSIIKLLLLVSSKEIAASDITHLGKKENWRQEFVGKGTAKTMLSDFYENEVYYKYYYNRVLHIVFCIICIVDVSDYAKEIMMCCVLQQAELELCSPQLITECLQNSFKFISGWSSRAIGPKWLLFDITTICAGLWTNLLGFVSGFYLVNLLIGPLNRFGPFRFLISSLSELKFVYNILYDRKSQVKFSFTATLIMSFLMWYGCDKVVVKEIILPVQNLSVTSGSLKLAVVSDIHAGASVYREQVSKVVDKILGLDVDAVTIVGDMVDGPVSSLKDRVDPFWQVSRRFPTYFVTGNHEYYYGNVMEWIDLYRQNGINVLQNRLVHFLYKYLSIMLLYIIIVDRCIFSHTVLRGVCLAGVNDISSGKMGIKDHYMNVSVAFSDCPKGATRILLSHNPASVKDISEDDLQTIDLILSGSTHENASNVGDLDYYTYKSIGMLVFATLQSDVCLHMCFLDFYSNKYVHRNYGVYCFVLTDF